MYILKIYSNYTSNKISTSDSCFTTFKNTAPTLQNLLAYTSDSPPIPPHLLNLLRFSGSFRNTPTLNSTTLIRRLIFKSNCLKYFARNKEISCKYANFPINSERANPNWKQANRLSTVQEDI